MSGSPLALTPVFAVLERSELLSVTLAPNSQSGAFAAADFGAFLYSLDSSGSTAKQLKVAELNNALASVSAWAPFRAKQMAVLPGRAILEAGTTLAMSTSYGSGAPRDWRGSVTMKFRRVPK